MDYNNIYKMVLLMLLTETVRSWPNQRLAAQNKDTEIVYIPYDVKYVPIEVPESLSDQLSHRMLTTFPRRKQMLLNSIDLREKSTLIPEIHWIMLWSEGKRIRRLIEDA
ncbi:uncharacterized protein LOC132708037 isoform X2 [Cylas formicarius]|uniref:uncharacterized protein LOC132708037 isoform X2 n=1 Tax=Cylas formicarius TaxID=197179 RepID=UPI0029587A03|nr:uncharacterized protein LOC132708037 isoform X2 [Cylas formicarius]